MINPNKIINQRINFEQPFKHPPKKDHITMNIINSISVDKLIHNDLTLLSLDDK